MKKRESEPKKSSENSGKRKLCMNCKKYNMDFGYCDNEESEFYQIEMRYDEECGEHI